MNNHVENNAWIERLCAWADANHVPDKNNFDLEYQ